MVSSNTEQGNTFPSHPLYCNSLTAYSRFKTRVVNVGSLPIGGKYPIRLQSMTTTNTLDTKATVEQSIRIIESGADLVRITAPSLKEANNLALIKKEIRESGYDTPLVADIHFTPNAAEIAARIVEKVRINPGNYADKKKFLIREYSDKQYDEALEGISYRFIPLVKICKEHGTALRIGTNHGSLSDRIMNRYGDTPLGMVESALEFVRICEQENFHELVLSMKASNPIIMVQAYRLLIHKMIVEGMNYPVHIGVTEAGEAEDGRIKSAVGIGALLEDGIGDTVRVSLTEEPEFEIPVAKALVNRYSSRYDHRLIQEMEEYPINPFEYIRRTSFTVSNLGGSNVPRVFADLSKARTIKETDLSGLGYDYSTKLNKWSISDQACDFIYLGNNQIHFDIPNTLSLVTNYSVWKDKKNKERSYPLFCGEEFLLETMHSDELNFISVDITTLTDQLIDAVKKDKSAVFIFETSNNHGLAEQRRIFVKLISNKCEIPVVIKRNYQCNSEQLYINASTDLGGLLLDGLGDGVWVSSESDIALINRALFGILQATRTRISKTDYISCPSCGRTLFDLQKTTMKIRKRTDHLKGLKIGIMGCIVNGPGEMADSDYGYVGTGPDKVTLYKGREVVQRNIPSRNAVDALINLIKEHGDWVENSE